MDGQQHLASLGALDGIQLGDGQVRVLPHEVQKVLVGPSDAASPVHLVLLFGPAPRIPDLSGQVYVPCPEEAVVRQAVEGALADHDGVPVVGNDMMEGLPFEDEGGDQAVEMPDVPFGKTDSLPCF